MALFPVGQIELANRGMHGLRVQRPQILPNCRHPFRTLSFVREVRRDTGRFLSRPPGQRARGNIRTLNGLSETPHSAGRAPMAKKVLSSKRRGKSATSKTRSTVKSKPKRKAVAKKKIVKKKKPAKRQAPKAKQSPQNPPRRRRRRKRGHPSRRQARKKRPRKRSRRAVAPNRPWNLPFGGSTANFLG